jgi:hypothetical protein
MNSGMDRASKPEQKIRYSATHDDELFPVKREYIGINSGVRRAPRGGPKIRP